MENQPSLAVIDLQKTKVEILKHIQKEAFSQELEDLSRSTRKTVDGGNRNDRHLRCTSPLYRLDPYLDENYLLRVGGRLNKGSFCKDLKHPVILPRTSHVTELIISHFHQKLKSMTTNEIRQGEFWIIGCSSAVYTFISKCVICRKFRGKIQEQKMSDLPTDRIQPEQPFIYSGVDFFGPFYIKEGRRESKRYGVLFTCMSPRAIHLETSASLDISYFINALRRFIPVRGAIRQLRSNRGTNFIGASRELREAMEEMNYSQLQTIFQIRDATTSLSSTTHLRLATWMVFRNGRSARFETYSPLLRMTLVPAWMMSLKELSFVRRWPLLTVDHSLWMA